MLSKLNYDCISNVATHLDFKNWHNFKNCSNELIDIVKDKNQIKNSYNGDWGSINIKGKKYNHHYFGSVIKPKKTYKKSQNGLIRHGMGIFTKRIGKYTYEIYRGLFFNDKLQVNHYITYVREEFTYKSGPYEGQLVPGITINKFNYLFTFGIGYNKHSDYLIKYIGAWNNNQPDGFGYSKELVLHSNYNKSYNPLNIQLPVYNHFIESYGTWKNGIKHGIFEERWSVTSPYHKYIRYVLYEDGKPINKSIYICRFLNLTLCSFVVIHDINNDTWKREYINDVSFNCKNISIDYFSVTKVQNEIVDPFDTDTCHECSCKICNICKKCK